MRKAAIAASVGFIMGLCFLSHKGMAQESSTKSGLIERPRTLIVTVTGKNGEYINFLGFSSFAVTHKKLSLELVDVSQPDIRMNIAVVFDLSGSMDVFGGNSSKKRIRHAVDALVQFVEHSHPANEYSLIGFNQKTFMLSPNFQNARQTIDGLRTISLRLKGETALYDALRLAVEVTSQGANAKRAIILVADGKDNASKSTFGETVRLLKQTDTLIYPIYLFADGDDGSAIGLGGRSILEEFAEISGGRVFNVQRDSQLSPLLRMIAAELRTQYFITFRSISEPKNKCYDFKVKVTPALGSTQKSLNARHRKTICDK